MAAFHEVAPEVWRLALLPRDALNVYLIGDILVDSGATFTTRRLLRALAGRELAGHVVTHAHPDHQGASHAVCGAQSIPLYCGEPDRAALETGDLSSVLPPAPPFPFRMAGRWAGSPHPVAKGLREGDDVDRFRVLETPGHTPGHIALWREEDGVLILGDVLFHRNPMTFRAGLAEPFRSATHDPATNRASARKLAALEPALICFGHGAPLSDGRAFRTYVESLAVRKGR